MIGLFGLQIAGVTSGDKSRPPKVIYALREDAARAVIETRGGAHGR